MDIISLTILQVFAQRYPRYLIKIVNRHEEFYALLMVVVERYYLRKYSTSCQRPVSRALVLMQRFPDASFAENFYGLKRRRRPYIEADRAMAAVGGVPQRELLSNKDIWRSLAFLVRLRPHV